MLKALISLSVLFFTCSCWAASLEVIGKNGELLLMKERQADLNRSAGDFTVQVLEIARQLKEITFEGDSDSIVSINGLGNEIETTPDGNIRAFGWCFSINGQVPEEMPDDVQLQSQQDRLQWFYAYALYDHGNWTAQCVPASCTRTVSELQCIP